MLVQISDSWIDPARVISVVVEGDDKVCISLDASGAEVICLDLGTKAGAAAQVASDIADKINARLRAR